MNPEMLNQVLLHDNNCFGCGHANPNGLHIEIYREGESRDRLRGIFRPKSHLIGFPGITHGGILYTALDCMAAWVGMGLRPESRAIWILRSASMTYHKPALQGQAIQLVGLIEAEGGPQEPMTIRTEALNESNELLADGKFKIIPLLQEKFLKITGIKEIPANWQALLTTGKN